jgi:RES domain-containing protein
MASRYSGALTAFRLASARYPIFDGGGAFRYGSRWCTPGRHIIHAASTYALAVLENIVHWRLAALPPQHQYIRVRIPKEVSRRVVRVDEIPGWDAMPYGPSQALGDRWYDVQETAVLIVPSVLSPFEPNLLLNARHPDLARVRTSTPQPAILDERLFQHAPS